MRASSRPVGSASDTAASLTRGSTDAVTDFRELCSFQATSLAASLPHPVCPLLAARELSVKAEWDVVRRLRA